jgi:eukaryotic-like serine/threonine-protein kinase
MPPESPTTTECPPDAAFVQLLDGRLAGPAASHLERHVAGCSACRILLDELANGRTELAHATTLALDDRLAQALLRDVAPGDVVGGSYRLVGLLGSGGMGAVYEAEPIGRTGTGERVAVKVIRGRLLAAGGEAQRRFRREARAVGTIDSPHIVKVVDSGADEATSNLYLVMERLHGEDLQQLLDRAGPLRPDVALRIATQALAGLAEAHAAGIVHRDIKPANLFLARSGDGGVTVKLLDFGIAKIAPDPMSLPHSTGLTHTGGLLGSPLYMSPEQVQNSKDVDHRTDLWSLGSTLYCALSGRPPHADAGSVGKLILAICGVPAPPLHEVAPWVPPEVAEVVHRAAAIPRDERYPSAAAMLDALRPLVPGDPALREEMLVGLTPSERARTFPVTGPAARPAWRLAAGAALLLGIAAAGYGVTRAPDPAPIASTGAVPPRDTPSSALPPVTPVAPEAPRRVMLVVLPEDASVEIDGAVAAVQNGAVELAGAVGSEHRVRVWKGGQEVSANVTVTEKGPVPPKVELPPRRPAAVRPEARGAPPGSSPPRPPEPRADDVMRRPE